MRKFLIMIFSCLSLASVAQDADYTDLRSNRQGFSHIYDKDIRRDLASFVLSGIEESINAPMLKKISISKFADNFIEFDSNELHITIRSGVFFPGKHKMGYEGKYLVKIDNRAYYGGYTKVPQTTIKSITVLLGKDSIEIPPTAYADLYNPQFTYNEGGVIKSQDAVYVSADKRNIYIYLLTRDENGSYEVTWIIQDKKFLRRVLDFGFTK